MANIFIGKNMSNIKNIPGLNKITKIHDVADYVRLADFVYKTISHSMDSGIDLDYSVNQLYWQFVNKKRFGWCYMHALYYHLIVQEYGRESFVYDYGLPAPQLTHSVVVVTLRDDKYLIDPYFNRYYVTEKGNPYTFPDLLAMIKTDPTKIYSKYGPGLKEVKQGDKYIETSPEQFEKGVLESWRVNQNYDKIMMEKFNSTNALLLMHCKVQKAKVCKKIDGTKYFDFF